MHFYCKRAISLVLLVVLLAFGPLCAPVQAAPFTLEQITPQLARLEQLADAYAAQSGSTAKPLLLTVNYLRASRYTGDQWDMVLGSPNEAFAQQVASEAPELAGLQNLALVSLPTGEAVDFVHLIVAIGATCQGLPVMCSWGGDCIQLAVSIQGYEGDEAACMQKLAPLFGAQNENASLLPQSDLIADLDGVNIGTALLASPATLAEALTAYYTGLSNEARAHQFVQNQFGGADTGDTEAFRALVKNTLLNDSLVQLYLMMEQLADFDSEKNTRVTEAVRQPLNAACSLLADQLSEALGGAVVPAAGSSATPAGAAPAKRQKNNTLSIPKKHLTR